MLSINISSLKNQLSAVLRKVRRGEEVLVLDRNHPVARISAVSSVAVGDDETRLADLERRGIIERAKKKLPSREWLEKHMVRLKSGISIVEELLKEREESR